MAATLPPAQDGGGKFTLSKKEYTDATWSLVRKHYMDNKGYELVKHLLDSYNDFISRKIENILDGFNPIEIFHQFVPEMQQYKYGITIEVKNPLLNKPTIHEKDGSTKVMTPTDARNRNFTYAAPLHVDLLITTKMLDTDSGEVVIDTKKISNVSLGKIPVMVNSRYCVLSSCPTMQTDECKYDFGGYFIVNGNEKVVISQDRIAENKPFVFTSNKVSMYSHICEIRSVQEDKFSVPKTTSLKLSAKPNQFGRYVRVNVHHIKHDIPLFVLFRALGVESDKAIVEYIIRDSDKYYANLSQELVGSIEEANNIMSMREAREFLCRYMNINGHPKEMMGNKNYRMQVLINILEKEFLPHVGPDLDKKAMYLGYMTRKLMNCYMGIQPYDDRDSYINKRVDTPGILMANLFRQYYGKVIKDMRNMIQKDINNGAWKATNKFSNVINKVNISKIVKSTIIESGLKFGLATGNWGIKTGKTKQGVAQVLNRMTYGATVSHLRRINTPIEKTGKLVQPRKLHSTQWGTTCPSETPEGVSVGLVKNMSIMCNITINSNAALVRELVSSPDMGVDLYKRGDIKMLEQGTKVFVNGDLVGVHKQPDVFYNRLKTNKTHGVINVFTSVYWNVVLNEIWICTEAGRCMRPLYIVRDNTIGLDANKAALIMSGKLGWNDLVIGSREVPNDFLPVIEYLDVEECNNSMIAMRPTDLEKGAKGASLPPKYTHLEMDPGMMLGVLVSTIPFSNHNQAPRNSYQAAQVKQALGLYISNYRKRFDTVGHVLNYPQMPLVQTRLSTLIHSDKLPCGINVIVAIATWTGFNQEDSIIMNKSSVDRGLFVSTYYRTYKDQNTKNHSTGEEEYYCKPDSDKTKSVKPYKYEKLSSNGFVDENTMVEAGDVIIGKCMPQKQGSDITNKDSSIALKNNEIGFVDKNAAHDNLFTNINGDGYTFAKVRIRSDRTPTVGDKFSCYTADHEVLTANKGWVSIKDLTTEDTVATMVDDALVYQKPSAIQAYDYEGPLYNVESNHVSLMVTPNHRMYVCKRSYKQAKKTTAGGYQMRLAEELLGKKVHYKKNVDKWTPPKYEGFHLVYENNSPVPTHFRLEGVPSTEHTRLHRDDDLIMEINPWLVIFGIWIAEGCASPNKNATIAAHKPRVREALDKYARQLNLNMTYHSDGKPDPDGKHIKNTWRIGDTRVYKFLRPLSVGAINKRLPEWVWYLSREQCQYLIDGMILGDGLYMKNGTRRYFTSSTGLADDFQRLCLHAGFSCNKMLKAVKGSSHKGINGRVIVTNADFWCMTVITKQNCPEINSFKNKAKAYNDRFVDSKDVKEHDGKVYCCTVPDGLGVIYVRRQGLITWSGNSRAGQKSTIGILYNQADMPFSTNGIVPDIIINPHAIPSRMTIGQLMESVMGKACASLGTFGDGSPFTELTMEDIAKAMDKVGLERYGNEILHNSRTGEMMACDIFMGPTYYQRLKHMVADKLHCLRDDHDVLTDAGWVPIKHVTKAHRVATLDKNNELVYARPTEILHYLDYKGKMYRVSTPHVDLDVTANHRMWVSRNKNTPGSYDFANAEDIANEEVKYLKSASWTSPDYKFSLPGRAAADAFDMDHWLTIIGIWLSTDKYMFEIHTHNASIKDAMTNALVALDIKHTRNQDGVIIRDKDVCAYLQSINTRLPDWTWYLSAHQCAKLVEAMCMLRGTFYTTPSASMAGDFMRLCLHAGLSANMTHDPYSCYRLTVVKGAHNTPRVQPQDVKPYDFEGPVYCLTVPNEVFMVRRNGKATWTGNSRAANGPVVLHTRQPAEGRAREGGLRLGEMEVECNWAHGTMQFLKERTMDNSDNYRVVVCKKCGIMANANPEKNMYYCAPCNNMTHFTEVRIPYACKLLFQEVQTLGIGTKIIT